MRSSLIDGQNPSYQYGLYQKGWNSLFIENHDQRRSVGRYGTIERGELSLASSKSLGI